MNVLAVGAHWDDIEIGCALTLRRMRLRGANVFAVVLTDSGYAVHGDGHVRKGEDATREGLEVFKSIGVVHVPTTVLPNQKMDYDQGVMQELEHIAADRSIDLAFVHWHGDHNTDHSAAWEICRTAFRRVGGLLQFQSNGYFDNVNNFAPQVFCGFDAKEYGLKKKLMAMHRSEWRYRRRRWQGEVFDKERHWGYLSGSDYAEAFMVSRLRDTAARPLL